MKIVLAFTESYERNFIVLCATRAGNPASLPSPPASFLFESENSFLEQLVAAELPHDDTISLAAAVLLSISSPTFPPRWVTVDLTEAQRADLGLVATRAVKGPSREAIIRQQNLPASTDETTRQLQDFLMHAPSPFIMLKGPEHVVTFINPPYIQILRRDLNQPILGLTIRELLPELEGQPFFGLLDQVYRTGVPYVGSEVFAQLTNQQTGELEDHYFDFVQHPTHDSSGAVSGIFVQAQDVTDQVLARNVSASREAQLYRQWAELDVMYRTAPVGMCLVEVEEYRILRMSDRLANLTYDSAENLIGQKLLDVFPGIAGVEEQLGKAAAGDYVRNFELTTSVRALPGVLRQWLVNFGPLRGESGDVEAIACVAWEITDLVQAGERDADGDGESLPAFSGTNH